jgi:small subunit ribosomal protein S17
MAKTLTGKVVSQHMQGAVVVEVTRRIPHPKYKKLLKRSKKFKAVLQGKTVGIGDTVTIAETRPLSKDIHFMISEVKGGKK